MKKITLSISIVSIFVFVFIPQLLGQNNSPQKSMNNINELRKIFDYNSQTPLDIQEVSVTDKDNIKVHDISYAGVKYYRITAYLVVPQGQGPFAGVVFLHWGFGDRSQFLNEAMLLTKAGILSLLINIPVGSKSDYIIASVINLRRTADLLLSREDVNADKLCYVGHSWGATLGGILAGVEKRFKTFILMAGYPAISKRIHHPYQTHDIGRLDAIHYIGHTAPSSLLFQFAENDDFVTKEEAVQLYEKGSEPKLIKWYKTDHSFNEEAQKFRLEWITKELNL